MTWQEAFFCQARSDNSIRRLLNVQKTPYAHQLHYLQMATEKLAKGLLTHRSAARPPAPSHAALVRGLQAIKARPDIRKQLGYADNYTGFCAFIDALLPVAREVEQLAPNFAGATKPNPEYPWQPVPGGDVIVPAEFSFPEFDPRGAKLKQLVSLVENLLKIV